jgi:hypothetical protein
MVTGFPKIVSRDGDLACIGSANRSYALMGETPLRQLDKARKAERNAPQ